MHIYYSVKVDSNEVVLWDGGRPPPYLSDGRQTYMNEVISLMEQGVPVIYFPHEAVLT